MFKSLAGLFVSAAVMLPAQTVAPTAAAPALTQEERELAKGQLERTRKMFLESVSGLTPEQWSFKAAPDRWSIAECAEHITATEDFIFGLVTNQVMKSAAAPEKREEVKGKDEKILKLTPDRSQKFKAPDVIAPKKRWATPDAVISHFTESRGHSIAYIETTPDDLREHFAPHPVMGLIDGYQWILLMSAHSERHTEQIQEVKADPKYPK